MQPDKPDPASHDKALDLVEQALDKYAHDKPEEAGRLVDKAQATDPAAAREVIADLDEDAASNHVPDVRQGR